MRRLHLILGLAAVLAFLLTGQILSHHHPKMELLSAEVRMMYLSRHIYPLGAALVNIALGLYLSVRPAGWRRILQQLGSGVDSSFAVVSGGAVLLGAGAWSCGTRLAKLCRPGWAVRGRDDAHRHKRRRERN